MNDAILEASNPASEPILEFPAPVLEPQIVRHAKWDREFVAFLNLLPALLQTHRNEYVAIHDGQVVASGTERGEVAMEAFRKVGYQELLVRQVTEQPPPIVRIPSVRVLDPRLI